MSEQKAAIDFYNENATNKVSVPSGIAGVHKATGARFFAKDALVMSLAEACQFAEAYAAAQPAPTPSGEGSQTVYAIESPLGSLLSICASLTAADNETKLYTGLACRIKEYPLIGSAQPADKQRAGTAQECMGDTDHDAFDKWWDMITISNSERDGGVYKDCEVAFHAGLKHARQVTQAAPAGSDALRLHVEQVQKLWTETWGTNATEQNWWQSPAGLKRWKSFVAKLNAALAALPAREEKS